MMSSSFDYLPGILVKSRTQGQMGIIYEVDEKTGTHGSYDGRRTSGGAGGESHLGDRLI